MEHHRFGSGAGLGGDEEERFRHIDARFEQRHRFRHGGVEHQQFGVAIAFSERAPARPRRTGWSRPCRGPPRGRSLCATRPLRRRATSLLRHLLRRRQPAEGVVDDLAMRIVRLPKRAVARMDARGELFFFRANDRLVEAVDVVQRQAIAEAAHDGIAPRLDGLHQLLERFIEGLDPLGSELLRDRAEAESLRFEVGQRAPRFVDSFFDRQFDPAMIAKRRVRRGRHGIHRVRADERLDVQHVAVARILRPGRRPERTLHARAEVAQFEETIAAEDLLE